MPSEAHVCAKCGAGASEDTSLLRCSRCKASFYCCRLHQKEHWPQHKKTCVQSVATSDGEAGAVSPTTNHKTSEAIDAKDVELLPGNLDELKFSADKEKGEDIGDIMNEHDRFEVAFAKLRQEKGLADDGTLQAAFDLMNSWIGLYRLEPVQALIEEVLPACQAKGEGCDWHIKAIQCRAFLRYKQHRFREALADFLEFKKFAGPSAELAENTGHAYNTLGDYANAEASFMESLTLMDAPGASAKSSSNRGGVLLGLGLVKERMGKPEAGLGILHQALEFYKARFKGVEHSLIAKTLMSVGHTQEKLDRLSDAEISFREATRIFKYTCGDDTPLTANAVHSLAKCLKAREQAALTGGEGAEEQERVGEWLGEAKACLAEALGLYVSFDTLHVYMTNIIEILNTAKDWSIKGNNEPRTGETKLQALHRQFAPMVPYVLKCNTRVRANRRGEDGKQAVDGGTAAVFFKVGGETCMLAGQYTTAVPMLRDAIVIFETVTEVNCQGLIEECNSMLSFTGHAKPAPAAISE